MKHKRQRRIFSSLVGKIYEASYRPEQWPQVLDQIRALTYSVGASLAYWDTEIKRCSITLAAGWKDSTLQSYNDTWGQHDPMFDIVANAAPIGTVVPVTELGPSAYNQAPEFFDWARNEHARHIAGAVLIDNEVTKAGISVQRPRFTIKYGQDTLEIFNELVPHIQRAIRIEREFSRLRMREAAIHAGLDRMLMGIVLLDAKMEVLYCNPAAQRILEDHPAIKIRNDLIIASHSDSAIELRARIKKATEQNISNIDTVSFAMGLRHYENDTLLPVLIKPISATDFSPDIADKQARVAIFISDPDQTHNIAPENLIQIYGLSHAEARVAIGIANGLTPNEIAESHSTSVHTIKAQLRAIFRKTGTERQAELVRLLLSGPFNFHM